MTKRELMQELQEELNRKKMNKIDLGNGSIGWNSTKDDITNALYCLRCPDERMQDYLTVIKLAYPNAYRTITSASNWLTHYHNRAFVYNTARMIVQMK
jgi:hypothetical protein